MIRPSAKLLVSTLALSFAFGANSTAAPTTTLYVSASGSDSASGSASRPLRSIGRAMALSANGGRIVVGSGRYPSFGWMTQARSGLTIAAAPGARPVADGALLGAARDLTVRGLDFSDTVQIGGPRAADRSNGVRVTEATIDTASSHCMVVRNASKITLDGNVLRGCTNGIVGPGSVDAGLTSSDITITDNNIAGLRGDGIQFGAWSSVTIARNSIRDLSDPTGVLHNDAVQISGRTSKVAITGNRMLRSDGQLIIVQETYGPNANLSVSGNVLYGSKAVAVQLQGVRAARLTSNTVWNARFGGLMIRRGRLADGQLGTAPRDAVVTDNLLSSYQAIEGTAIADSRRNVLECSRLVARDCVASGDVRLSGEQIALNTTAAGTAGAR